MADSKPRKYGLSGAPRAEAKPPRDVKPYAGGLNGTLQAAASVAYSGGLNGQERQKVLLSVGAEDLKQIDANAEAAGMSRSAYLVAAALHGGASVAPVLDAIELLRTELARFEKDASGWRGRFEKLQKENAELKARIAAALDLALIFGKLSEVGERYESFAELLNVLGANE